MFECFALPFDCFDERAGEHFRLSFKRKKICRPRTAFLHLYYLRRISLGAAAFPRERTLERAIVSLHRPEDSYAPTRNRLKTAAHRPDAKKHRVKRRRFQGLRAGVALPSTGLPFLPTEVPLNATKLPCDLTQVPFLPPMFRGHRPEEPVHSPEVRGRPTKLAWKEPNFCGASPKHSFPPTEVPLNATKLPCDYTDASLVRTNVPLLQRTFRGGCVFLFDNLLVIQANRVCRAGIKI